MLTGPLASCSRPAIDRTSVKVVRGGERSFCVRPGCLAMQCPARPPAGDTWSGMRCHYRPLGEMRWWGRGVTGAGLPAAGIVSLLTKIVVTIVIQIPLDPVRGCCNEFLVRNDWALQEGLSWSSFGLLLPPPPPLLKHTTLLSHGIREPSVWFAAS
jgi:hypothetical protein